MLTLEAPYPGVQTTSVLPSPLFSNAEFAKNEVSVKRAEDGTTYTYVKRQTRRKLQWTFRLTRAKGRELRAFLEAYFASKIKATDHDGEVWIGYFTNNPFEFDAVRRGEQSITLEFEGELQ